MLQHYVWQQDDASDYCCFDPHSIREDRHVLQVASVQRNADECYVEEVM